MESTSVKGRKLFLPRQQLDNLVQSLTRRGYSVVAPTVVQGVIGLRPIQTADQIPRGLKDRQDGGTYELEEGDDNLLFDYVLGPDSPKRFLFPPSMRLLQFYVRESDFELHSGPPQVPKLAFLGLRPCELAAIEVQDRVFGADDPRTFRCESEPWYTQIRQEAIFIAVNCTRPGGTCFCASWDTGPEARNGHDLALTELRGGYVVDIGSRKGADVLEELDTRDATEAELELSELKIARSREHMGRDLDTSDVREVLSRSLEAAEWEKVARRCLSCGNCTMVCPTCFCSSVSDSTDLADGRVTRTREWESCFTQQFTYTTGGPGRESVRGRYRQWLRHKLCTWWDQFGTTGCVGCGRCITWCPVGIDLTEEVRRIRDEVAATGSQASLSIESQVAP